MVSATLIGHEKFITTHSSSDSTVIVEVKIWEVQDIQKYPEGIKYSLYCVDLRTKEVIIGIDNHHPKGHHIHIGSSEFLYQFQDVETLVEYFFNEIRQKGYLL
jgi:hypothetical protein